MTPILQLLDDFGSAFLKASDGKHAPLYGRHPSYFGIGLRPLARHRSRR